MKMQWHKLIASIGGTGYLKGGGTFAAILYCLVWLMLPAGFYCSYWQIVTAVFITLLGVYVGNRVDAIWGKDSSKVVIDEVAGMAITLLFVPCNIMLMLIGLFLFRFFDIVKPLGIRKMENLPKGWGVMADDVLAGIYSLFVMQLIIYFQLHYSR
jgi:phosphatidylglycerophosphatase A